MFTLVARWMFFTPEFQLTIVLISSPLALIVALWGMTDKRSRQLMQSTRTMPSDSVNAHSPRCHPKAIHDILLVHTHTRIGKIKLTSDF